MRLRPTQYLVYGGALLLALACAAAAWTLRSALSEDPGGAAGGGPVWAGFRPAPAAFPDAEVWARPGLEQVAAEVEHYRLAGTFQTYDFAEEAEEGAEQSLALVDDVRGERQLMVREGEALGPFTVARIEPDRITLEREGRRWTLALPGTLAPRSASDAGPDKPPAPVRFEDLPALETSRFGKKVSDNQWVLRRRALLDYAGEIVNNPLRATRLYRSFRQEERDDEPVGFRLDPKGERDFFRDMGLGSDDVILKVNSMRMKNQTRAEYLVGEFMKARMSAVVLDVERDGEVSKQIYIIR